MSQKNLQLDHLANCLSYINSRNTSGVSLPPQLALSLVYNGRELTKAKKSFSTEEPSLLIKQKKRKLTESDQREDLFRIPSIIQQDNDLEKVNCPFCLSQVDLCQIDDSSSSSKTKKNRKRRRSSILKADPSLEKLKCGFCRRWLIVKRKIQSEVVDENAQVHAQALPNIVPLDDEVKDTSSTKKKKRKKKDPNAGLCLPPATKAADSVQTVMANKHNNSVRSSELKATTQSKVKEISDPTAVPSTPSSFSAKGKAGEAKNRPPSHTDAAIKAANKKKLKELLNKSSGSAANGGSHLQKFLNLL